MKCVPLVSGLFCVLAILPVSVGQSAPEPTVKSSLAPDYSNPDSWVCRPGKETVCTDDLDAKVVSPSGATMQHFRPATNPSIDCFYVYPTVGGQAGEYANMTETPQVRRVVHTQAGRLSSRCRVFAPIYRQGTLARLTRRLAGENVGSQNSPREDIHAAWEYYLAHDNGGRGVVLMGHSQGTGVLQNLMIAEIDGKAPQSLLVAAFLAGDPSLAVPPGKKVGGTFKNIPVCSSAAETGCAWAWGTYRDSDATPTQNFGRPRADGMESACANPAAPSGGTGSLKFYHAKALAAPASDPQFVEFTDLLTGACKKTAAGNGFRVSVKDGPYRTEIDHLLDERQTRDHWGLHGLDVSLVQGNILDVLDAEIATWKKNHPMAAAHAH